MLGAERVTTPVRASVQTGAAPNLGREPDFATGIGRGEPRPRGRAEVRGCARLNHWLTPVVTISVPAAWRRSVVRALPSPLSGDRLASRSRSIISLGSCHRPRTAAAWPGHDPVALLPGAAGWLY